MGLLAQIILACLLLLVSCSASNSDNSEYSPGVQMKNLPEGIIEYFSLIESPEAVLQQSFEAMELPADWVVLAGEPIITDSSALKGSRSLQLTAKVLQKAESSGVSLNLTLTPGDYALSFYNRCDLPDDSEYTMRFVIDGVIQEIFNGHSELWKKSTYAFTSGGSSTFEWIVENSSGASSSRLENSAWIDFVSLIKDEEKRAVLVPGAIQRAVVGETEITYQAYALRADNSIKKGITFNYSVSSGAGTITAQMFSGTAAGNAVVRAESTTLSVDSEPIKVYSSDYKHDPFEYNGTLYQGTITGGSGSTVVHRDAQVSIEYPQVKNLDADAFFTLQGTNNLSDRQKYLLIRIEKDDQIYDSFVSGIFSERIWLTFGTGEYQISIYRCTIEAATVDESLDGDILAYSWHLEDDLLYQYNITNIRDEDGRFIYPSLAIQSDSIDLYNLAQRETAYLNNEPLKKIVRLHDYVVTRLYYDTDSLTKAKRKKQDVISVLKYGTAVCEGYTGLYAALLRISGFRTKAIAGNAFSGSDREPILHAWCNIFYENIWYLTDPTWNDPTPFDDDPSFLRHKYLMLETLDGDYSDHQLLYERPDRSIRYMPDKYVSKTIYLQ